MWPAIIGALTGIGSGLLNFFGGKKENETNAQLTRETNAQNEALMREQWAREDTAIQRRAEDLQNAGLSKTLAAGSPASAGSLATMQPASYKDPTQNALNTAYSMMSMVQDFEKRQRENQLLASQARNVDTKTVGDTISNMIKNYEYTETLPIDKKIKMSILDKNLIEYQNMLYNLDHFGNIKGPSNVVRPFFDVFNFVTNDNPSRKKITHYAEDIGRGRINALGSMFTSLKRNLGM